MKVRKKYKYDYLIAMFAVIVIFRPRIFNYYKTVASIHYVLQLGLIVLVAFLIISQIIKKGIKSFSLVSYAVIIYKLFEMYAMYQNGVFSLTSIVNAGVIISSTVLAEYLLDKIPEGFLSILSIYSGLMIFVNNISFYIGNKSNSDATGNIIYFWQTKNHLSSLFFIAFISAVVIYGIKRSRFFRIWTVFIVFNIVLGVINFNSSTTIVGLAIMIALYFLFKKRKVLCKPIIWFGATLVINYAIVVLRVQQVFSWIIVNVLHKSLSFTGRTQIWDMALLYIARKPIFGYGESAVFDFSWASSEVVAHNQFLDIAIICGIPGMLLFVFVLFMVFKQLDKYKNSAVARILLCSLLGYMVMTITESPNPYQPWFVIFGLAVKSPQIDRLYTYVSYTFSNGILKIKKTNYVVDLKSFHRMKNGRRKYVEKQN